MKKLLFYGSLALFSLAARPPAYADDAGKAQLVDFNDHVRPILARHCFKCHGPDEKARKARLRLDVANEARKPAGSGERPIVPGRPDESELVRRIFAEEADERMPPPEAKLPLAAGDREILKRWIAQGAKYEPHWAFRAPSRPAVPAARERNWVRSPIDAFVLARLEEAGLEPSPEADRAVLLRRASLDLVGLPPAPEEIDAFLADTRPDAYERQVDRLLASPRYGERWARRWLDLARYADTNGYEKDRQRSIWPYRDWVIRAFNLDLPFDRFTIEQLAGDMLAGASQSLKVATGFHRNTMLNEEGGIDPLEFRFYAMTDRVATTATVWLGLTLGCAQCHTHKFDPLPQREYYQFMALLDNADEPELSVPTAGVARRRRELEARIAALEADLPNQFPIEGSAQGMDPAAQAKARHEQLERRFSEWLSRAGAEATRWTLLEPVQANANLPHLVIEPDGSILASGDQTKRDVYTVRFRAGQRKIAALRLETLCDASLPSGGPGRVYYEGEPGNFFLSELRVRAAGSAVALVEARSSNPKDRKGAAAAIDGDPQTGWTRGGRPGSEPRAVFRLATPLEEAGELEVELLFERYHAAGLGRFRISATSDPHPSDPSERPVEVEALLRKDAAARKPGELDRLQRFFLAIAPELAKARMTIEQLQEQIPRDATTLVMKERPPEDPRPTFVHKRGEFLQPAERAQPAVLSLLAPSGADAPRDRLGLARWLVSGENPLTARVTMNRQWAAFFGRGLVRTVEDFGYQGERPTHPELLDWLALELVKKAWSIKAMHRLIVTSAVYRQSSRMTPERRAKDPENRLFGGGPRVRLEAEVIRDSVLRASGLLAERLGGPSVFPPQPPGVTTEGAYGGLAWQVSPGPDRYRRGLYTFSKRTAPYATFSTFDAPSGEICIARREVSNSPLQALALLNDTAFEEGAQALGHLMAAAPGSVAQRAGELFRRCLTRRARPDELAMLVPFYQRQRERLTRNELDAGKIAGPGEGSAIERAAWTLLARAILNLDEAVTKG
jgi:Protein of unknown function (DUF1549)/Protein of unknown function (DUF1553)/Planctomycete cytochrome C